MMKKLGLYGLALVLTVGMWWGMTEAGEMEGEIWLGGNTPPVANDDPDYTTPVNVNLISSPNSVLDNDTDAEGDGLTAVLVQTVSTGTLALQGDGTFIYLPPTDFAGVVTFTYRADDNISLSNVAVATITVNNPPVANDDWGYEGWEDDKVWGQTLLANDDNGEGDTAGLTAVLATGPMMGGMDLRSNGHFTYTPPVDYYGVMTFTYRADDGVSLSAPALVTMTVLPINDAPWGGADVYTMTANTDLIVWPIEGLLVNDWDVEGHIFTPTLGVGVAEGTLIWWGDGGFAYQPPADFTGVVTFTYVISEGGGVLAEQKISDTEGGFGGGLSNSDYFGIDGQYIGDIDGDGIGDIAIGATSDDDGGTDRGAVWILFLNRDGTVKSKQKISATQGGFGTGLDNQDYFGNSVTSLGDLDLDGVGDIAVGAFYDGDGGYTRGAVWILFLNRDGTIKAKQKISDIQGGFTGVLMNEDKFGVAVGQIGDLNGDGIVDIAVGAYGDDEGGSDRGAIWILFLNRDGTVISHQKINDTQGGFAGDLDNGDTFGNEIALLGDIDNDGFIEIAVGAYFDDDGGLNRGAVWILSIDENGIVQKYQKISDTVGGFGNQLSNGDFFGIDFSVLPDMNGDGINDLIVGAIGDDGGGSDRGAAWVLFLTEIGTVSEAYIINDLKGGFDGELTNSDYLGDLSIGIGDLDNNGVTDFGLGARNDDDGGGNRGAIWLTFMKPHGEAEVEVTIIVESACTIPERVINNEIDLSTPDVYFNWDENGATAYELWRSSDPYFMVGAGDAVVEDTVTAVPAVHLNGAGDVNSNYYYGIVAVGSCGDRAALSSRLGAFDYGLVRGQ